jgi:ABC-type nitrate/sulfonate/bicarbonate transport system ATPase subunit
VIEARGCGKVYPGTEGREPVAALVGIDLVVRDGEFVCVLGPSGCGKTTLLRMIAGLVPCSSGELLVDGVPVSGPGLDRAMVFQQYALLPWRDVARNVEFGLELRGVARPERARVARELIAAVGLAGFERHLPGQLSGGMQQRVGLARALAVDPRTLLMDEPFGSVDTQTRRVLQEDLLRLQAARPQTVVFVTHSMDEAVRLGDRVVLLSARPGRVREVLDVPLPRPRPAGLETLPAFIELKEHLWRQLRTEATR